MSLYGHTNRCEFDPPEDERKHMTGIETFIQFKK